MKKISVIILFIGLFIITGCNDSKNETEKVEVNGKVVDTSKMEHKHCTRKGKIDNGDVSLNYDIYYTNDILNIIKSEEKIVSPSDGVLDIYEEAYKKIHQNYEGLEYYDTKVVRGDTSVTSTITIDYDKIDIDRLISIEGEEDNVFENKVPKVEKWIKLAEKFGTKCEIVED